MILVTVLKKQGVELAVPYDLALDPEKIVNTRVIDGHCELDYAETFDRNREEITYEVTAAKPNIDATITGDYSSHTYLNLVVYWSDNKDLIPFPAISTTYTLSMQEKYIVDIQDVPFVLYWKNQKISTTRRKVRFVPGAFKQEVIYVTNALNTLVDNTPSETTTTTTAELVTTTTEPATTTTTYSVPCENAVCESVLTVGEFTGVYGYGDGIHTPAAFGDLTPDCRLVFALYWLAGRSLVLVTSECYDNLIVYIDSVPYPLILVGSGFGIYNYAILDVDNPFPVLGATHNLAVCADECTTTTTEVATTTTTELGTTTTTPIQ